MIDCVKQHSTHARTFVARYTARNAFTQFIYDKNHSFFAQCNCDRIYLLNDYIIEVIMIAHSSSASAFFI